MGEEQVVEDVLQNILVWKDECHDEFLACLLKCSLDQVSLCVCLLAFASCVCLLRSCSTACSMIMVLGIMIRPIYMPPRSCKFWKARGPFWKMPDGSRSFSPERRDETRLSNLGLVHATTTGSFRTLLLLLLGQGRRRRRRVP
mmetsp:Transcript_13262/g.37214  ORF Transcript_13262/g.37214 Transcript_13262/m.37214 type:complete len:143 (+) Transcript_13262:459-887(+)